jgi:hypothetical protein
MKIITAIVAIFSATTLSVSGFTPPIRLALLVPNTVATTLFSTEPEKEVDEGLDLNLEEMFDM